MTPSTKPSRLFLAVLLTLLMVPSAGRAELKTVTLPLTIDYPLLRSLVVYHAFTGPDRSAIVLDEGDGCNFIRIADPIFSETNGLLRCETRVLIRTGAPFRDTCLMPVEWAGYLILLVQPQVDPEGLKLTFRTFDSAVYDADHRPQAVPDLIWDLIRSRIYVFIHGIAVDLKPPIDEMKRILVSVIPEGLTARVESMLDSLRLGEVRLEPEAVHIAILAEVEEVYDIEVEREAPFLTETELEKVIESWETWDAFLVHMILTLAGEPLTEEDRRAVFETLLDARYRFTMELTEKTLGKDLVREEFIDAWTRLSPVFRNHLGDESSEFTLAYLAFFTAADALATLDRIGPTLGIEISREGLIRLGRLISREKPVFLDYDLQFNRELREVLGLGATPPLALEEEDTPSDETELPLDPNASSPLKKNRWSAGWTRFLWSRPAWAGIRKTIPESPGLEKWLPPEGDLAPFIRKMETLLTHSASALLKKSALHRVYRDFYKRLTLSTAWQESCFRQFVKEKGEVTYLLSYNRTSVGIMQVNRRVWRGIYDLRLLMWNIHYNAAAGCEILEQYLHRYALPQLKGMKQKHLMTEETVAGTVYAMYNGGPQQFSKYLARRKKKDFFLSDRLFMEKFRWTTRGQLSKVESCLR